MADHRRLNAKQRDYTAYGLHVRSSIALPFRPLLRPSGDPDVCVGFGEAPPLRTPTLGGTTWQAAPGALLLHVDGVARYAVTDGTRIAIQPEGGSERDFAAFLSGSVFGACLQQRGIALFHASAVAAAAGAALILGPPGIGKSTLLAAMTDRGYAMLADDAVGVVAAEGTLQALPAFPSIGLWPNSLEALGWGGRGGVAAREGTAKSYARPARFHGSPIAVHGVFSLRSGRANAVNGVPRTPRSAWEELQRNGYQRNILLGLGRSAQLFRMAAAMASSLTVRDITYDISTICPQALAKRLAAALEADAPPLPRPGTAVSAASAATGSAQ